MVYGYQLFVYETTDEERQQRFTAKPQPMSRAGLEFLGWQLIKEYDGLSAENWAGGMRVTILHHGSREELFRRLESEFSISETASAH